MFHSRNVHQPTVAVLAAALLLAGGCRSDNKQAMIESILQEAKQQFAPDRRTVVFDVTPSLDGDKLVLSGEVHNEELKRNLLEYLRSKVNYILVDSLRVLPGPEIGEKKFGVITVSVANLRSKPAHPAELSTQALLGTPIRVLKKEKGWYYVQLPDEYLGWMDDGFEWMDASQYDAWKSRPKIIVTTEYAFTRESPAASSPVVSDVAIGCILALVRETGTQYEVAYPDGRRAYLAKADARPYPQWLSQINETPEHVIATARRFMGVPYLWGGTSSKGFDCSGYTKTVFFLGGIMLPRDASQQVLVGEPVDPGDQFQNVKAGDLLFFGFKATEERKERVTHVGIYIGNSRFIHASGDVRVNSLRREDPDFSEFRFNTFLRAMRVLGAGEETGVRRLRSIIYYQGHERRPS
jgi:hypothetical protein